LVAVARAVVEEVVVVSAGVHGTGKQAAGSVFS
jgi:hypothetical protein